MRIRSNTGLLGLGLFILAVSLASCTGDSGGGDDGNTGRSEAVYSVMPAESLNNVFAGIDIPQNPGLAPNNWNGGHQDSFSSDSVKLTGPVSRELKLIKQYNPYGFTPIMACNGNNQMVGIALNYTTGQYHFIVYDTDLHILAHAWTAYFVEGSFGGGYFILDDQDNAIVVGNNHIKCFPTGNVRDTGTDQALESLWVSENIVSMIPGAGDNSLYGAMPVWDSIGPNLFWCLIAGKYDFDTRTLESSAYIALVKITPDSSQPGGCRTTLLDYMKFSDEWNNNTFSVDEDGAYIVTNAVSESGACDRGYLHALGMDPETEKIVSRWRHEYLNSGFLKPGMKNIGSGTTPTLLKDSAGRKLVTIGDNAYPRMNVEVVRQEDGSLVSRTPVFSPMRSADEASFIAVDRYIVAENNFGHTVNLPDSQYVANEPGMALISVDQDNESYPGLLVWENESTSFFAMSMLCRESGIIFSHTGDWFADTSADQGGMYYISALDSWDGRVIWRIPLGRGQEYCHEYGGIYFDRSGKKLFMGTNSYLVSIQECELQ